MSDSPITTIADLLADCKLDVHVPSTLRELDSALDQGRSSLLAHLKDIGVSKLPDRQALANGLGKAKRAGRVLASPDETAPSGDSRQTLTAAEAPPAGPPASAKAPARKLRVLCLHAFRTNGAIFRKQMEMAGVAKLLEDGVELVFLDGPHVCTPEDNAKQYPIVKAYFPDSTYGSYREWFNATEVATGGDGPPYVEYAYKEAALSHVAETLAAASPPFDGVLGFSQGGSLAMWVTALSERGLLKPECPRLKFALICSARLPRDHSCKGLFDAPLETPIFVSFNGDDQSVKAHETRQLVGCLREPVVVEKEKGGHAVMSVARSPEDGEKLKGFLQKQGLPA